MASNVVPLRVGKNIIKDDILAPEPFFNFEYTGKNPSKAMRDVGGIVEDQYGSKSITTFTKELKWYPSESAVTFYGNWVYEVKIDGYTNFLIDVRVIGKEDKTTKEGNVSIIIHPYLLTTIEVATNLQKTYYWLWEMFFYNKQRAKYLDNLRSDMATFKRVFMEKYGIGVSIG